MSLSDPGDTGLITGRVILGAGGDGESETTLAELDARRSPVHYEEVEAKFWERVRAKATAKASEIVSQAMAEAEKIKAKAQEDGYAAGVAAAEQQIQTELAQMAESLGKVMDSVAAERKKLWSSYRQDFVTLLRMAVERTITVSLDTRRQEIVASLLDEALELVDAKDALTLTVHPDDEGLVRELMARSVEQHPGIGRFQVRGDAALLPGSIHLESADGLVDNAVASRFAEVETIFAQLAAGDGDADAA